MTRFGGNWEESDSSLRHKKKKILNFGGKKRKGGTGNWTACIISSLYTQVLSVG